MQRYIIIMALILFSIFSFGCSSDSQQQSVVTENQEQAATTQYGNKLKILLNIQNDFLSANNTKIFYEGTGFDRKGDGLKIFVNTTWNNISDDEKREHLARIFISWIETAKANEITVNPATFHVNIFDYKSNAALVFYNKDGIRFSK